MTTRPATHQITDRLKKWLRGRTRPRRGYRDRAIAVAEVLEARQLLTSMLYLDCGAELATNSTGFHATVDAVKNVDGVGMHAARGTGPDLQTEVGLAGAELLQFKSLHYDWNGNGVTAEDADMEGMCSQVLELVNRSLEPYDIQAEVTSATSLHQIRQRLDANTGAISGEFDAYVFVGSVFYDQLPIDDDDGDDARRKRPDTNLNSEVRTGNSVSSTSSVSLSSAAPFPGAVSTGIGGSPVSVGLTHGIRGMAAMDDFYNAGLSGENYWGKNQQDEMAITFADQVLAQTSNNTAEGHPFLNRRLAFGLADSVLRNAMTTYGLHEVGDPGDIIEEFLTMAETMRHPDSVIDDYFTHNISSNFDFKDSNNPGGEWYNPWEALKTDNDIGLRDDNQNGVPDVAYITGSGAHDLIQVTQTNNGYKVTVTPFKFKNLTGANLITGREMTYSIQEGVDTDGPILIDASYAQDKVEVVNYGRHDKRVKIRGGHSHDRIIAGNATNEIYGDHGNDMITGGVAQDTVYGGYGRDSIFGNNGHDTIYGEHGTLYVGGGHHDLLNGQGGNDEIHGDGGRDTLVGGNQRDILYGDDGNDRMHGQNGGDSMFGGKGHDIMRGGRGRDRMNGGHGRDRMDGQQDNDTVFGGSGNDYVIGNDGEDKLFGNAGRDTMVGGAHDDFMRGGSGNDLMMGHSGADTMYGGSGEDKMYANRYVSLPGPAGIYRNYSLNDQALDKLWGQGNLDWLEGSDSGPKDQLLV